MFFFFEFSFVCMFVCFSLQSQSQLQLRLRLRLRPHFPITATGDTDIDICRLRIQGQESRVEGQRSNLLDFLVYGLQSTYSLYFFFGLFNNISFLYLFIFGLPFRPFVRSVGWLVSSVIHSFKHSSIQTIIYE